MAVDHRAAMVHAHQAADTVAARHIAGGVALADQRAAIGKGTVVLVFDMAHQPANIIATTIIIIRHHRIYDTISVGVDGTENVVAGKAVVDRGAGGLADQTAHAGVTSDGAAHQSDIGQCPGSRIPGENGIGRCPAQHRTEQAGGTTDVSAVDREVGDDVAQAVEAAAEHRQVAIKCRPHRRKAPVVSRCVS